MNREVLVMDAGQFREDLQRVFGVSHEKNTTVAEIVEGGGDLLVRKHVITHQPPRQIISLT